MPCSTLLRRLQLTYEGLLDEVFNLSCGQLRMPEPGQGPAAPPESPSGSGGGSSSQASSAAGPGKKVYGLNSADAVFR